MSTPIRIGINGFGRIGRTLFRMLMHHDGIEVVHINDIADAKTLTHLLKYDSIHGVLTEAVSLQGDEITIGDTTTIFTHLNEPKDIPWKAVDLVVECSGKFKSKSQLEQHLKNEVKRVILSVPPVEDDIKTVVLGVNDHQIDSSDVILSNASCTTNNAAPMLAVIEALCGIEQAYITTVHSYTTDQSLHDQPHRDLRRARAAGQSIVPTTTPTAHRPRPSFVARGSWNV